MESGALSGKAPQTPGARRVNRMSGDVRQREPHPAMVWSLAYDGLKGLHAVDFGFGERSGKNLGDIPKGVRPSHHPE